MYTFQFLHATIHQTFDLIVSPSVSSLVFSHRFYAGKLVPEAFQDIVRGPTVGLRFHDVVDRSVKCGRRHNLLVLVLKLLEKS